MSISLTIKYAAKGWLLILKTSYKLCRYLLVLILKLFSGMKQALTIVPVAGLKYFPPPIKFGGTYTK